MTNRRHPGPAILGPFYASTYRNLLDVRVPEEDFVGLLARAADVYRDGERTNLELPFAPDLAGPLQAYMSGTALRERFEGVIPHLATPRGAAVLDIGCGDGTALRLLADEVEASLLVGVDPIHTEPVQATRRGSTIVLVPSIADALQVRAEFDVVCVMYTLHHMTRLDAASCVGTVARSLAPGGKVLLVEDNPSPEGAASAFDRSYAALGEDGRRAVLELNDYWANVVVHGRPPEFQHYTFRTPGEWMDLLGDAGLEPARTRSRGFNASRLHGVPSFEAVWRREGAG